MLKRNKIFFVSISIIIILLVTSFLCSNYAFAAERPSGAGLIEDKILEELQVMMRKIYMALSLLFMLGSGLICYAKNVANTCLNILGSECYANIPNFNLLISGMLIYGLAFFMCISIGMYFIDISFKIGFAIIFLPISIGLWPFKPTYNKFSENLSIIIRNSMLFLFVSIGSSFAVLLIVNGIFGGGGNNSHALGWNSFWESMEEQKTNLLVQNFTLDSVNLLLLCFCLVFGFKILGSSINNYLDYFFQDSVFGNESPMHHMGTQAVGMAANYTVKPAMSFAKDVASNMAGQAMIGMANGLEKLSTKEGRQQLRQDMQEFKGKVGRGISHIVHPVRSYNQVMATTGKQANKAVKSVGKFAKSAADLAYLVGGGDLEKRAQFNQKVGNWIDQKSQTIGNAAENVLAHGGGMAVRSLKAATDEMVPPAKRAALMERAKQKISQGGASAINMATMGKTSVTADQVRKGLHKVKDAAEKTAGGIETAAHTAQRFVDDKEFRHDVSEFAKDVTAAAGAAAINLAGKKIASKDTIVTARQVRQGLHAVKTGIKGAAARLNKAADTAPITLQPSAILKTGRGSGVSVIDNVASTGLDIAKEPARIAAVVLKPTARLGIAAIGGVHSIVRHPQQTIRAIRQFAQSSSAARKATIFNAAADGGKALLGDIKQFSDTSALFKGIKTLAKLPRAAKSAKSGIANAIGSMEQTREQANADRIAAGKEAESATKYYLKKSGKTAGKVVLRTAKGTAEDSAKLASRILRGFGESLSNNKHPKQEKKAKTLLERMTAKTEYEKMVEIEEERKRAKEEARSYYSSLTDN